MGRFALVGLVVLFLVQAFALQQWGVRATPDSVEYVAMAESLVRDGRLDGFAGRPSAIWPPGYAILLAPFVALWVDPLAVVPWLHAALWTAVVGLLLAADRARPRRWIWRAAMAVALLVGAPSVTINGALLSGSLFVAVMVGCLIALGHAERRSVWAVAVVLAGFLPVVRLVGVAVWPALLVVGWRRHGPRTAIAALALACVPLGVWIAANVAATGHAIGSFPGDPRPFGPTLRRSLEQLARWWVPQVDSTDVLLISVVLVVSAVVVFARRRGLRLVRSEDLSWILTAVATLAVLWIGSTRQRIDLPDHRLMAPLFVLVVVLTARLGDRLHDAFHRPWVAPLLAVAWTATIASGGLHAVRSPLLGDPQPRFGRDGEVARALEGVDAPLVWSNYPELVHWHRGMASRWTTPEAIAAADAAPGAPMHLVWFRRSVRTGLLGPRALNDVVAWDHADTTQAVELWTGHWRARPPR